MMFIPVIPAQAGIHLFDNAAAEVDARLRGHDEARGGMA